MSEPQLDETAQKFLGEDNPAPKVVKGMSANSDKQAEILRKQRIIAAKRAAKKRVESGAPLADHLYDAMGKFRQDHGTPNDAAIFGVALFAINMRESYGDTDPDDRAAKLEEFDAVCEEAQEYWDKYAPSLETKDGKQES